METIFSVGQDLISIFSDELTVLHTVAEIGAAIVSALSGAQVG